MIRATAFYGPEANGDGRHRDEHGKTTRGRRDTILKSSVSKSDAANEVVLEGVPPIQAPARAISRRKASEPVGRKVKLLASALTSSDAPQKREESSDTPSRTSNPDGSSRNTRIPPRDLQGTQEPKSNAGMSRLSFALKSASSLGRSGGLTLLKGGETERESVCSTDPCGEGAACLETPGGDSPYKCYCADKTTVVHGMECHSKHVNVTPSAVSLTLPNEHPVAAAQSATSKAVVVVAALSSSMLLLLLVSFAFWKRKKIFPRFSLGRQEKNPQLSTVCPVAKATSVLLNFASNPNYYAETPEGHPCNTLAVQLIDREEVRFLGELGEGCFGKVYKGEYGPRGCPPDRVADALEDQETSCTRLVAVKVLKEMAGMEAEADFLREVEIMAAFRHENILSLIGIVFSAENGTTPWMVFEYMPYGDLTEVLRSCNSQFFKGDTPIKSMTKDDLLFCCVQIASGMTYLSSQHFVHRDLACRNCLVGRDLAVKISDFGMARDVYTCDYYKVGGSRMLPVRWMSPESIMYGKYTLESDVWSFGVVLWEVFSYGKQPYYGNSNEEVVKLILQGILLSPPDTCPPAVCQVLRKCWATEPCNRLGFPEILSKLREIRDDQENALVVYSELSVQDQYELDCDQYLMPRTSS